MRDTIEVTLVHVALAFILKDILAHVSTKTQAKNFVEIFLIFKMTLATSGR